MTRTELLNQLIAKYHFKSYLEIGLDDAVNFQCINIENKESVDPYFVDESGSNGERIVTDENGELLPFIKEWLTYRMTSDEFFAQNKKTYDLIFIDGLHTKEQVSRDLINSLKCISDNGIIVLHDCIPICYDAQIVPRETQGWNGDVWKSLPCLSSQGLRYNVIDDDFGLGIVQKTQNTNIELYEPSDFPIEYDEVFSNPIIRNLVMRVDSFENIF